VAEINPKRGRPFTVSEYVKQCMLAVTEEERPYKKNTFGDISLYAQDCARCTEELGARLPEQIKMREKLRDSYLLSMDETKDVIDIGFLMIFILVIDDAFTVNEETAAL
jgi:hypothetical protein